jgi:hypothetical protein
VSSRDQLQQAYALIKGGKKAQAVKLLVPILKTEAKNAAAWWLMANALEDPEKQRKALEKVLQLKPGDARATAMLDQLDGGQADDIFNDPNNPFVQAKATSTFQAVAPTRSAVVEDDPFGDVEDDGDDPFSDTRTSTVDWVSSVSAKRKSQTVAAVKPASSSSNSSMVILGGVVLIVIIAVAATAIFVSVRNSGGSTIVNAEGETVAYFDPIIECGNPRDQANENRNEGDRVPRSALDLGSLDYDDVVTAEFEDFEETHAYTFEGQAGAWVSVEMTSNELDPVVEIFDPDGLQFAFCDDRDADSQGNRDYNVYMEVRLPVTGTYTILAQEYAGFTGRYRIVVRGL